MYPHHRQSPSVPAPTESSPTPTTPIPFSPFSTVSIDSNITRTTADEPGDLGAFSSVFRALNEFQRARFATSSPSSSFISTSRTARPHPRSSSPTPSASPAYSNYTTDLPLDSESEARVTSDDDDDDEEDESTSTVHSDSSNADPDVDSDSYISDIYGEPLERPTRTSRRAAGSTFGSNTGTSYASRTDRTRHRDADMLSHGQTVWNEEPVASYLAPPTPVPLPSPISPPRTPEVDEPLVPISPPELEPPREAATLGAFEGALAFLATERERLQKKLIRDQDAGNLLTVPNIPKKKKSSSSSLTASSSSKKGSKSRSDRSRNLSQPDDTRRGGSGSGSGSRSRPRSRKPPGGEREADPSFAYEHERPQEAVDSDTDYAGPQGRSLSRPSPSYRRNEPSNHDDYSRSSNQGARAAGSTATPTSKEGAATSTLGSGIAPIFRQSTRIPATSTKAAVKQTPGRHRRGASQTQPMDEPSPSPRTQSHAQHSRTRSQQEGKDFTSVYQYPQSAESLSALSLEQSYQYALAQALERDRLVALRAHLTSLSGALAAQFPADSKLLNAINFEDDPIYPAIGTSVAVLGGLGLQVGLGGVEQGGGGVGANGEEKGRVHVFVDHSNILIGFTDWIRRQYQAQSQSRSTISVPGQSLDSVRLQMPKRPQLSHASLALLLERGRRVGKRVLVASSPLYQNLDDVVEMGYQLSVLQRVPIQEGSGAGTPVEGGGSNGGRRRPKPSGAHRRTDSSASAFSSTGAGAASGAAGTGGGSGDSSTESGQPSSKLSALKANLASAANGESRTKAGGGDEGSGSAGPSSHRRHRSESNSASSIMLSNAVANLGADSASLPTAAASTRTRYREEAVDELLQLKILQTLISHPSPPPRGSTIVLATGDGASSQFNPDGFLGCVRTAVERGWRVELVGWEENRSRSWAELAVEVRAARRAAMGSGPGKGGLFMIDLEKWGWELFDSRVVED
ncbi:hypothetical protein DL93DRAFT_2169654 [Clavulina sp. PMI_390]|nr:hypothetical protein DL93DRAFT_2169654 [Clavulina sp. PMI_390]